jgi:gamma-glutamyltranspeptidase / glutathione hydrolase
MFRRLAASTSAALTATALLSAGNVARSAAPAALESRDGMVVTAQHLASDVGAAILRQGGNAVDAAVAVGYALAVTHPCCGNLGGGGFMMIHLADGRNTFINFREKAPLAARADMFLDARGNPVSDKSVNGYLAVGVPGTVMGLDTALKEYGSLPRSTLMAASIRLARNGFILTPGDVDVLDASTAEFRGQPNVAAIFLNRGAPFKSGERLVQSDLAATLSAISERGAAAFYQGPIADTLAAAAAAHGGLLTAQDFANYTLSESAPISCSYRGYTILSAPPPSSGGVILCEMLQVLEAYPLKTMGFHSSDSLHVMTEAMRSAYRDRNTYLGDPAFVDNPIARLLSRRHIESIRARIQPRHATPSSTLGEDAAPDEKATTTHYSVVDGKGNAVAVTYTINDDFGAKVIAGDSGFFLNDEMDDFTAKPGAANLYGLVQGKANAVAPGKRPLSSMTPTIVLTDGRPLLVLGAPGGSRITTTVLEIIVNVIDHGMTLQEAVDAPRIHHQWLPDTLAGEPFAFSADTVRALTDMGYHVVPLEPWGTGNAAEAIGIAPVDAAQASALGFAHPGVLYGASDSRAPAGSAAAPGDAIGRAYAMQRQWILGGAGGWDYLTIDSATQRLFISRADRVLVMNLADGNLLATIADTAGVHGIALAPDLGRGFTSNGRADTVTVFDLKTLRATGTIAVSGHNPDAILYDGVGKRLYTFNGRSKDISVIDPLKGAVISTLPAGGKPEFAATDGAGRIFYNIEDTAQISVLDTSTAKRIATWPLQNCEEPTGLALDAAHQRLFSVCQNGILVVTDAASGRRVAELPIGKGPDAAAFDEERGLIFSSNGEDGTLTMIHEDDPDHYSVIADVATQESARTMALDARTHQIYLVAARFGAPPQPSAGQPHPRPPVLDGSFKVLVLGN